MGTSTCSVIEVLTMTLRARGPWMIAAARAFTGNGGAKALGPGTVLL